jgi:hypothetical protein
VAARIAMGTLYRMDERMGFLSLEIFPVDFASPE